LQDALQTAASASSSGSPEPDHSQSLVEAKRRIRKALSLCVEDADDAELVDDVTNERAS
jgi:hypothetical protein